MTVTSAATEAASAAVKAIRLSKMAEYAALRSDFSLSHPEICKRVGISERTGHRYRAELIKLGVIYPRSMSIVMNQDRQLERVRNMPRHPDGRFV